MGQSKRKIIIVPIIPEPFELGGFSEYNLHQRVKKPACFFFPLKPGNNLAVHLGRDPLGETDRKGFDMLGVVILAKRDGS